MRSPSVTRVSNRLGASRDMALKQPSAARAEEISSGSTPRASADSARVGVRPRFWVSSDSAAAMAPRSSWTRRGGRTLQPWSRKCRLTSPEMVGTA